MNDEYKVYAVDFDGTLCEDKYPDIGAPNNALIISLILLRRQGHKLILWTCRGGEYLKKAVDWCKRQGLEFDAVNENLPERIQLYGNDCRKIGYDILIDDKAVSSEEYHLPFYSENCVCEDESLPSCRSNSFHFTD